VYIKSHDNLYFLGLRAEFYILQIYVIPIIFFDKMSYLTNTKWVWAVPIFFIYYGYNEKYLDILSNNFREVFSIVTIYRAILSDGF
jgi:hypothetical protein